MKENNQYQIFTGTKAEIETVKEAITSALYATGNFKTEECDQNLAVNKEKPI